MVLKLFFIILMALGAIGEEDFIPEWDRNILSGLETLLKPFVGDSLFDGPTSVCDGPTSANKHVLPTLDKLKYYMYFAASTYFSYDIEDLSCEYCLKFKDKVNNHTVLTNDVHNTMALVVLTSDEIVVAFRGTLNIWNVVLDFFFIPETISNGIKIHRGFHIAVMSLYENVVRTVAEYLKECPNRKVVITGHSLGGAMARLMYFFLEYTKQFPEVTYELYTYGEPRVGNERFAEFMNSQPISTARVVTRADVVAHLPPISVLANELLGYYVHPQTEVWITGEKNHTFCEQTVAEDRKCSISMGPDYTVADHFVYFDTDLKKMCGQPFIGAALPFDLFNAVKVIPPLPKPIENLVGRALSRIVDRFLP